ncbi:hypothetical protein H2198_007590 [Neophaeococcomyces mojaviensis]|uniref:Uncharacterized protein n=1 Tax=Neophaeococcomyces mojaviensis TaxID=3383035 RepID=A0ACC2ZZY0_9EURO|nr:hypothetical protein H2198_007590 [Knufia sp. JES_112]
MSDSDRPKKAGSIPEWQKATDSTDPSTEQDANNTTESDIELINVARQFLAEASVQNTSREEQIEFLKGKGLSLETIEKLLNEENSLKDGELRTVHDTSNRPQSSTEQEPFVEGPAPKSQPQETESTEPRPELAPIITYPEFLLKPQKPPPLITISRLVNAAYVVAGFSGLTWAASKYILDPMLQTLTEARHGLADTTLRDLEQLNAKLEGTVSHVPYIVSAATRRHQEQEEDTESLDSDPTELFHRDVATQTTPGLSRSSSTASLSKQSLDPTILQANRISNLTYTLKSLMQSIEHSDNEQRLHNTVGDFQKKLDNLESSYNQLRMDYYASSSIYSTAASDTRKTTSARENEAQKFKQEIRSLKGAFLSSRNFPTAPRPTAAAGGYGAR